MDENLREGVNKLVDSYSSKLYEDLSFAAPELWQFKIKLRMEQLADDVLDEKNHDVRGCTDECSGFVTVWDTEDLADEDNCYCKCHAAT